MEIVISRWGNSLGVRLPKAALERAHLHEGDTLAVETTEEGLLLRPVSHLNLENMLAAITPENAHAETLTGEPMGREIW